MGIPNVRRYRITSPDGKHTTTLMAVLPKGADVNAYLADAAKRFDWAAYEGSASASRNTENASSLIPAGLSVFAGPVILPWPPQHPDPE